MFEKIIYVEFTRLNWEINSIKPSNVSNALDYVP